MFCLFGLLSCLSGASSSPGSTFFVWLRTALYIRESIWLPSIQVAGCRYGRSRHPFPQQALVPRELPTIVALASGSKAIY